jgi:hypothetical protein
VIWTVLWLLWGLIFAVVEGAALANDKKGDTLSEHLRRWFRVDTHLGRTAWLVFSALFFIVWFIPHIAVGWNLGL